MKNEKKGRRDAPHANILDLATYASKKEREMGLLGKGRWWGVNHGTRCVPASLDPGFSGG